MTREAVLELIDLKINRLQRTTDYMAGAELYQYLRGMLYSLTLLGLITQEEENRYYAEMRRGISEEKEPAWYGSTPRAAVEKLFKEKGGDKA